MAMDSQHAKPDIVMLDYDIDGAEVITLDIITLIIVNYIKIVNYINNR